MSEVAQSCPTLVLYYFQYAVQPNRMVCQGHYTDWTKAESQPASVYHKRASGFDLHNE